MKNTARKHSIQKEGKRAKRVRSSHACLVCRQRKVKCDAMERYPEKCTNCVQFNIPRCEILQPRKRQSKKLEKFLREHDLFIGSKVKQERLEDAGSPESRNITDGKFQREVKVENSPNEQNSNILQSKPEMVMEDPQKSVPEVSAIVLNPDTVLKKVLGSDPTPEYVGLTGPAPIIEQILQEYLDVRRKTMGQRPRLDATEYEQLVRLGCFTLPREDLCHKYIEVYFRILHWQQPVLDKRKFLHDYKNLRDPPSLLLLQAVLFAGSRFYEEDDWSKEQIARQDRISYVLHRRAQSLYSARLEASSLPMLQALIIFGNYWDSDFISAKNSTFCYLKVAVCTAYSIGIHKNKMVRRNSKLLKRIWWALFMKDTFSSFAFGRPWSIDLNQCDVDLLTEDDMLEEGSTGKPAVNSGGIDMSGTPDSSWSGSSNDGESATATHVQSLYFVHRVRLACVTRQVSDIMHEMHKQALAGHSSASLLAECNNLLTGWLQQLPKCLEFTFDDSCVNNFYAASLALEYYSIVLIVYRGNIVYKSKGGVLDTGRYDLEHYPSWSITFKAAHLITYLGQYLEKQHYLQIYHCFVVYSMITAGIMMICHLYNEDNSVSQVADTDIRICLDVMKASSSKWPISRLGTFYLDAIYHNKPLQCTVIRDILEAANKSTFVGKVEPHLVMLDSSVKNFNAAGNLAANVSAQRSTSYTSSSATTHSPSPQQENGNQKYPASRSSTPGEEMHQKMANTSAKSIMYEDGGPSASEILMPTILQRPTARGWNSAKDERRASNYSSLGKLAEAASAMSANANMSTELIPQKQAEIRQNTNGNGNNSGSQNSLFSAMNFPGVRNTFPEVVKDNWRPKFDTSSFPTDTFNFDNSSNMIDDFFDYLGGTNIGLLG